MSLIIEEMEQMEKICKNFLFKEAKMLDDRKFNDWIDTLSSDLIYRVPVRTVRDRDSQSEFSQKAFYLKEDFRTLKTRVLRQDSEYAWSENPPTRTRRMVSNISVSNVTTVGDGVQIEVTSNIAVFCYRGESPEPMIMTGERQDRLIKTSDAVKLEKRIVLLDTTVIGLPAFSIFL